jgi:hypothetical protein
MHTEPAKRGRGVAYLLGMDSATASRGRAQPLARQRVTFTPAVSRYLAYPPWAPQPEDYNQSIPPLEFFTLSTPSVALNATYGPHPPLAQPCRQLTRWVRSDSLP